MFGVLSVIYGYGGGTKYFFYCYLQLDATLNTGNMDSSGTFTFVDDVLLARTVTRTCTNSVSVASPRLDTQFNLNVTSYDLFYFNHFQAVRFVANVRLFIGPNLEGPF